MEVYMDNGATTRVLDEVAKEVMPYFTEKYGNPSSLHAKGLEADHALQNARSIIAKTINASPEEIVFTSGATESNNLAILGTAHTQGKRNHLATTTVEHPATKNTFERLAKEGFEVSFVGVDSEGFLNLEEFEKAVTDKTLLVSIIHANHEIGTIQDIKKISEICKAKGALLHIDSSQAYTKVPIDVKKPGVDFMSINSHKIHGPKGAGALYIRKGLKPKKLTEGGPQESSLRAGTENLPGIMGFAKAAEIGCRDIGKNTAYMVKLRDNLIKGLLEIPHTRLNGPKGKNMGKRLCNNVDVTFDHIEGEAILMRLDMEGIYVSTGSACSSKTLKPSHILKAIGLKHEQAHGAMRFSLSKLNTQKEVDYTIKKTREVVSSLREISSFVPEKYSYEKITAGKSGTA